VYWQDRIGNATIPRMKQSALKVIFFTSIVLSTLDTADAAQFNQYVGFGDSTLDSGYFRYHTTGDGAFDALIAAQVASGDTGAFVANGVLKFYHTGGKV